jgi:hypothetical protein
MATAERNCRLEQEFFKFHDFPINHTGHGFAALPSATFIIFWGFTLQTL